VALDPRILRVNVEVNNQLRSYQDIAITVTGTKYTSPNQGECNITLTNLRKEVSDYILTETSPYNSNRTPKSISVEAGRVSTGLTLLYSGNIFRSSIGQPPDSVLSIRALTGQFQKGNIVGRSITPTTSLSRIAQQVAGDLGLSLDFQATDKESTNYQFSGAAIKQIDKIEEIADVDAFVDNKRLIVKDKGQPRMGKVRNINADTGMVGVPTFTEQGARITFFYDAQTVVGGRLNVVSRQYPALTGSYVIYKLNYTLTNRDTPFYYTAECSRLRSG